MVISRETTGKLDGRRRLQTLYLLVCRFANKKRLTGSEGVMEGAKGLLLFKHGAFKKRKLPFPSWTSQEIFREQLVSLH